LLGDFDSIKQLPKDISIRSFPAEKDDTDTMLAIKAGLELGYLEFHLHGCAGGRLDHTLANLQSLFYLAKQGARGFLYGEHETYTAIENGTLLLPIQKNGTFSVFCFGSDATGVSIVGAQYTLSNATLTASFPLGVSNHFKEKPVSIHVKSGCLLVGWQRSE
jgi:thiamine pyrophosphokinase